MKRHEQPFPFSAIVGQEDMKLGLMLNIVYPKLSGMLAFGEKGTAKSTAVRAIAKLLPDIAVIKGCRFRCDPNAPETWCEECRERAAAGEKLQTEFVPMRVVDLPVSATEDRVVGSLDLEQAIQKGKKRFEPGVLADANRGILYVDEVNLLDDHIVDLLLDSAAMGVNTVEREGISFSHPAQFILVGTMNPEEGELRPQLLDRFGLSVRITSIQDPQSRVKIVKYRNEYEENPVAFGKKFESQEAAVTLKLTAARNLLSQVEVPDEVLLANAKLAIALKADGHRADLTMMKALRAYAALEGRTQAGLADIEQVAGMVFLHRLKSLPFEQVRQFDMEQIRSILQEAVE